MVNYGETAHAGEVAYYTAVFRPAGPKAVTGRANNLLVPAARPNRRFSTRMDDTTQTRMPRLAPLLLIGVLAWLAIVRPGNLAGESAVGYRVLTSLLAVAVVGYVAWRFHGILPAVVGVVLLRLIDPDQPVSAAFLERGADAVLLATLAVGIAAGARQAQRGTLPWVLLGIAAAALAYFGWCGRELPAPEDGIARARVWHVSAVVSILAVPIGLTARKAPWRDKLRLVGVMILIPAIGVGAAVARGDQPPTFSQANWHAVLDEWKAVFANHSWDQAAWCWTNSWVAGLLVLVGIWRTLARGRNQAREGQAPLAWLITVAAVGALVGLGGRQVASSSLALAAVGVLLSVFALADLIQLLIERVELKPPEAGPSAVPRVK